MGCGASAVCSSRVSAVLDSSRCCSSEHFFRDSCLTQGDEDAALHERSAAEDCDGVTDGLDTFSDMGSTALLEECEAAQRVAALPEGELFRDEDFPAEASSLSHSDPQAPHLGDVVWLRPHCTRQQPRKPADLLRRSVSACVGWQELVEEPRLLDEGRGVSAVRQGALGDCWLLSACAAVAQRPHLLRKVVPGRQPLRGAGYRGAVRVRLWRFGRWRCVLLDDRLPARGGAPLYASCAGAALFWVCFVEKAYAKLHGSYEALAGGHALEALVDLTGGVAEKLRSSAALYPLLRDAFARGDLVTCAKKGNWASVSASRPAVTESGLARGHAYTVREVRHVRQAGRRPLRMVRVRNPWADHREWTGAWSDGDGRWQLLDEETRREMGALQPAPDGEFWMEFSDFQRHFSEITVATLVPDLDCDAEGANAATSNGNSAADRSRRYVEVCHGEWVAGRSAGGCRNDISKFTTNPQFLLTLTTSDPAKQCPWKRLTVLTTGRDSTILYCPRMHRW
ncbi:calpain-9-like [Schistocerca piceifrons]|uniref:calpain-9-like n=1 Tax=Schistocerca piceifrons TaxID=274613 RepID=UPI001F5F1B39|nr:calpain-9-like [Schistocerca piceifrons]